MIYNEEIYDYGIPSYYRAYHYTKEGVNGFMIWERDPKLFADKIELLINNEKMRLEMGKNAREFAKDFGIEKYVDQLLELYLQNFL